MLELRSRPGPRASPAEELVKLPGGAHVTMPWAHDDEAESYVAEVQALGARVQVRGLNGKRMVSVFTHALPYRLLGSYRPLRHGMEIPDYAEEHEL